MNRSACVWVLAGLFSCGSCGGPSGSGAGGGSGGSASGSLSYALVEASGSWNLAATADPDGSCAYVTKTALRTVTFAGVKARAADYSIGKGTLTAKAAVDLVVSTIEGEQKCVSGQTLACPKFPDPANKTAVTLTFKPVSPLPVGAENGRVLVPELANFQLPELCAAGPWTVGRGPTRGRPITVAELKSGRFVIEGNGVSAVAAEPGKEGSIVGTLTYEFRFVFQTDDYDPRNAVAPTALTTFDDCTLDLPATTADLDAAQTAYAAGNTDIALNASGCRRLAIMRAAGRETINQVLTRGTSLNYDPASDKTTAGRDAVTTYVREVDATTGIRERFDSDGDGVFEAETQSLFDQGLWKSSTTRDLSPTNTVARETTVTRVDATTAKVEIEEEGVPLTAYDTPVRQEACYDSTTPQSPACPEPPPGTCTPTPVDDHKACSPAEVKSFEKQLANAVAKGSKCLARLGLSGHDPSGRDLTLISTKSLDFLCTKNKCDPYGFLGELGRDGRRPMLVNLGKTRTAELGSTLFHEMLHSDPRFTHSPTLEALAGKACKHQLVDRTNACESLCMGKNPSSCDCIRCLTPVGSQPKPEICEKCKGYGGCAAARPNVSSKVGAYCKKGVFCDTKVECATVCPQGFGSCHPYRATCESTCN